MKKTNWTDEVWSHTQPILAKILTQDFIQGLIDGSLAKEKFIHYVEQDALYLEQYRRAMSNILPKLKSTEHAQCFLSFIGDTIAVENELHQQYLGQIDLNNLKPTPTNLLYTQYLLATTSMSNAAISMAAILPCFWIYKYVGDHIISLYKKEGNPYFKWIQTYSGDEFGLAVEKAIKITNELASQESDFVQQQMTEAFIMASKMEFLFWDSAYLQEQWKI